jgi:hypothetical protein
VRGALRLPEYVEALGGLTDIGGIGLPPARRGWTDTFVRPVFIDGRRAGTWRRLLGREVVLETNLFARLDPVCRARLGAAVGRYGKFAGLPSRLQHRG